MLIKWFSNRRKMNGKLIMSSISLLTIAIVFSFMIFSYVGGGEIKTTNAIHLDTDYSFISDVYEEIKERDNLWSKPIYENQFIRITLERNLTYSNDITLYVRNKQKLNTYIEVYYKNSNEKIVEFPHILNEQYYKIFLTNLKGNHDTFDLKIVNNDVELAYLEFDHILDPIINIKPTAYANNDNIGTNPGNAYDNDFSTYTSIDLGTGSNPGILDYFSYNNAETEPINNVNVTFDLVVSGTSNDRWGLQYSDNDGTNWYDLRSLATGDQTRTNLTYTITEQTAGEDGTWNLSEIQSDLRIRILADKLQSADGATFYIYETWLIADYSDTNPPLVIIESPDNTTYSSAIIELNVSADQSVDTWWYEYNSNGTNITFTPNTTFAISDGNGTKHIDVYANSSAGNTNYSSVYFTVDTIKPIIILNTPNDNYTINNTDILFNFTVTDNIDSSLNCSIFFNGILNQTNGSTLNGTNTLFNVTGIIDGNYTWNISCNDDANNINWSETRNFEINISPFLSSISASPSTVKGGDWIAISPSGISEPNFDNLYYYCDNSTMPNSSNNDCSQGNQEYTYPYSNMNCTFQTQQTDQAYTVYCRVYDGSYYSDIVSVNYTTDSTPPTTNVSDVAGDSVIPYYDNVNDGYTNITINGENGMDCRLFTTDTAYSPTGGMGCIVTDSQAVCSPTPSQGTPNYYISCADSLSNGQNTTQNLDVTSITVDWTAPTTFDDSDENIHVPPYVVNITESDNIPQDVNTTYCIDVYGNCTPSNNIDDGEQITFTSLNRGRNYLRYNSTDYVGNKQTIQNKTMNINQLPIFNSADDGASNIKGGVNVTINTVSYDPDSSQTMKLYVCNTTNSNSSGCIDGTYCSNITGSSNLTCTFTSETDDSMHTWYAFFYDELNEEAVSSPKSGSYTTESTPLLITIIDPDNDTYSSTSIQVAITINEPANWAGYSLNNGGNVTMSNSSTTYWFSTINVADMQQHNIIFYANDTTGNMNNSIMRYFSVDTTSDDTSPPSIIITNPENNSYQSSQMVWINITLNENGSWSGYILNSGSLQNMSNSSRTAWYKQLTSLTDETQHNITVYANDTSYNKNQGNKTFTFYVDTKSPTYVSASASPNPANQSQDVKCSVQWTDTFGLNTGKVEENSSGSFVNHTVSISGTNNWTNYTIPGDDLSVGSFECRFYVTDLAGNSNTTSTQFTVQDITLPTITINSPVNDTYTQNWVTASITLSEAGQWTNYSLDGQSNVTMSNTSSTIWSATITSIPNGQHTLYFYTADLNDNIGTNSVTFTVNTDTVPPSITIDNPSNNSYLSSQTVWLNITLSEDGSWSGYTLNGGSLQNMSNSSLTAWYKQLTSLTDETQHNITIYANDTATPPNQGNKSLTFYVDTKSPTYVSVSASPNPANQSQDVKCSVQWTDTFGLNTGKVEENSSGSFVNHTVSISGTSNWTNYTIPGDDLSVGSFECRFYVTDLAGNSNTTSTQFAVQDITLPTITINSPVNDTYTQNWVTASIILSEAGKSANYSLEGQANVSMTNSSSTIWSATITSISNDQHTVYFYATDLNGNIGTNSVTFTVNADTIPPSITIDNPSNNSYLSSQIVWLNITLSEDGSWSGYSLNGGSLQNMSNSSRTAWYKQLTSLTDETQHNITIYANDTATPPNQGNKILTFYADTKSPTYVSASASPNPANQSQDVKCSVQWIDTFGLSTGKVEENSSGSFVNHTVSVSGTNNWTNYTIPGDDLSVGSFECRFYVTDLAGNSNTTSTQFTVQDITLPTITINSPVNDTYTQNWVTASIILSEAGKSANYSLDGQANVSMTNSSSTIWSATITSISNDQHTVYFYATDLNDNIGTNSVTFTVNTDTVPPSITIDNPNNNSYQSSQTIWLNITLSEDGTWSGYSLNNGSVQNMSNSSLTAWYKQLTSLTDETQHNITIYANDTATPPNQGNKILTFYVDTKSPTYTSASASPNPANQSQDVKCSVQWTDTFGLNTGKVEENSSGSFVNHTISISGTSNWTNYTIPGDDLSVGSFECRFYVTDLAGNSNTTSTQFAVQDITLPTITINSPVNDTYTQNWVTASITLSEAGQWANYSLDSQSNISMTNTSSTIWSAVVTSIPNGQHTLYFYTADLNDNIGTNSVTFTVNADTIPPSITIDNPVNNSYQNSQTVWLNITLSEDGTWSGYSLNNGSVQNMSNSSLTVWYKQLTSLTDETQHNITIYANDTATPPNQGNKILTFYVDTKSPTYTSVSASPNPANQSQDVKCFAYWTDTLGLNIGKVEENSSGSFVNHTVSISGTNNWTNYTIPDDDLSVGSFECRFYVTDLAGNTNTTSTQFTVQDITSPIITITYPENTTYTQNSVSASITLSEAGSSAWYCLDSCTQNITMTNSSPTSWSKTITNLSNSAYVLYFYTNDSSGNLGSKSIFFTVDTSSGDTSPPSITIDNPSNNSYQSSQIVWINITLNENGSWSGYTLNGGSLQNMSNSSLTSWYKQLTNLTDETQHNITIYANDTATPPNQGNKILTFYVDTKSPTYTSVSASPNPANQSQDVKCSVQWTDTFGLSTGKVEENSSGSFVNHTVSISGTSNWTNYTVPGDDLSVGSFECRFYVTDLAGNSNTTFTQFTVQDIILPTITINSPVNDTYTQNWVTVSITLSEAGQWANYSLDGQSNVSMTNSSSTIWSATITSIPNGQHTLYFYTADLNDNIGTNSVTFTVNTDTVPPSITIDNPSNNSYISSQTVWLNITLSEDGSWSGYRLNNGSVQNMSNSSLTAWYKQLTSLTDETQHNITVYANDTATPPNQGNKTFTFYVDTKSPTYVSASATPNPANQSQNVKCSVQWIDTFGLNTGKVEENSSGSFVNHTVSISGTNNWTNYTIPGDDLSVGSFECRFYVTDLAGNSNTTSTQFTVQDITLPTITINSPVNDTYTQNWVTASISLSEAGQWANYSLDGQSNVSMTNSSSTIWSATITSIPNGQHTLYFYTADLNDNIETNSVTFTVNADTVPPSITIDNPSNNSYQSSQTVWINITLNENGSWSGYTLNGGSLQNMSNSSLTAWYKQLTSLTDETQHNITIYANDTATPPNQGNKILTFYVDTKSPTYTSVSASPDPANQSQDVKCSAYWTDTLGLSTGKIEENSSGSFVNHTVSVSGTNNWTNYTIPGDDLNIGSFECRFYVTDLAGNTNITSTQFTVQDIASPIITINSPVNDTYTQNWVTASISLSEAGQWANYSLDSQNNISMTNSSSTIWSATITSIPNGQHTLYFYTADLNDNIGTNSVTFTVNADTVPPSITIDNPSNNSYLSSQIVWLNITLSEDGSWSGYSLNNGSVQNMFNSSLTAWYKQLTSLTDETQHNITIYVNDTATPPNQGNKILTFYVDTKSPTYASASASPNLANQSQDVKCSAYWTDTLGLNTGKVEENSSGSFVNHTVSVSGTNNWTNYTIPSDDINVGSFECRFYVTDLAGNTNTTSTQFTVQDITSPIITINSPVNDTYTQNWVTASIILSEAGQWANYSLDDQSNVSMSNSSSTIWYATISSVPNGQHTLYFYAIDLNDNIGTSSITFTINADTIPPSITIDNPSNNSYQSSQTVWLNITLSEDGSWSGYRLNNGSVQNMFNTSSTAWYKQLTSLTDETQHNITIYANDTATPPNQGNKTLTFYVDTKSPTYTSVSASPDPANQSQDVKCSAYWTDTLGLNTGKIEENSSGSFVNHTVSVSGTSNWTNYTIPGDDLSIDSFECRFYVTDLAGNLNTTFIQFTVQDITSPIITIAYPENTTYTQGSVSASITLSEAGSSAWYCLDSCTQNITMTNSSSTSWYSTLTNIENDAHTIYFYANDSSGNLGSNSVSFTVDTTLWDNTPPSIIIWSPVNGTYYTNTSVLLNIALNENGSWAGYSLNNGIIQNMSNSSLTNWNKTINMTEARYNITFYANDTSTNKNQGNSSVVYFIVDATSPQNGSIGYNPSSANNTANITCYSYWTDNIGLDYGIVEYNVTGTFQNSSIIDLSGTTSGWVNITIDALNVTPGNFTCRYYAFDQAGLGNLASWTVSVADVIPPSVMNFSYIPNTTDTLDPNVQVNITANVTDDYNLASVTLQYKLSNESTWNEQTMTNNSVDIYGGNFTPTTGNWSFRINATDSTGNENITNIINISIRLDKTWNKTTTIENVKSIVRTDNRIIELGNITVNNTGDFDLNFTVSSNVNWITFNGTSNNSIILSVSYSNSSKVFNVTANMTDFDVGLYNYNITIEGNYNGTNVSSETVTKAINIQNTAGPYLITDIYSYSSNVTQGETYTLSASVRNYGTADATGVWISWGLPGSFSIVSGSQNRSIGNLPIGATATNTIVISVGSAVENATVIINATSACTEGSSSFDSKSVTIGEPVTVTETVPGPTSGGETITDDTGAGALIERILFGEEVLSSSEIFELVRGYNDTFPVIVKNTFNGTKLYDVSAKIDGYLSQYMIISPNIIDKIEFDEMKQFDVTIISPDYMEKGSHKLTIVITGKIIGKNIEKDFIETRSVVLIIHTISREEVIRHIEIAESDIAEMDKSGFPTTKVSKLLNEAKKLLEDHDYETANEKTETIRVTKKKAFEAYNLIQKIKSKIKGYTSITGAFLGVSRNFPETENLLNLAQATFEREDYDSALQRAKDAQMTLALESSEFNLFYFLVDWWWIILLSVILISSFGVVGYKTHAKSIISQKIRNLEKEEETVINLMKEIQKKQYRDKTIGIKTFQKTMIQYQKRLSKIRQLRSKLRHKRVRLIRPEKLINDLRQEREEVVRLLKNLQRKYFVNGKIGKKEYDEHGKVYTERLSEIEDEQLTLETKLNKKGGRKK